MHYGLIMIEFIRNATLKENNNYRITDNAIQILENNPVGLIFMTAKLF